MGAQSKTPIMTELPAIDLGVKVMMSKRYSGFNRSSGAFGRARRSRQQQAVIALASCLVIFCGGLGLALLNKGSAQATPVDNSEPVAIVQPELVQVVVANRTINPGEQFNSSNLQAVMLPSQQVASGAIKNFHQLFNGYAVSKIEADSPIYQPQVSMEKPTNVITAQIPEGHRAVTIRVDATTGVEGWARAGARVDVSWIGNVLGRPSVTTIVHNAEVLSAERQTSDNVQPNQPLPSTVTLLVKAEDSQKIQLARSTGSLTLSLRGSNDSGGQGIGSSTITINDIIGNSAPVQAAPVERRPTVKIRGPNGELEEFVLEQDGRLAPRI